MNENILEIYMNYLYAKRMHEEYGNLFGDTDDIIKYYETKINELLSRKSDLNNNISCNTKILKK